MRKILLDNNVILRFLEGDTASIQYEQAVRLFFDAEDQRFTLLISPEIMAEVIYVLQSYYRVEHSELVLGLERILFHSGVMLTDHELMILGFDLLKRTKLDIADCFLAASSFLTGCEVASFDKDFKKLPEASLYSFT